MAKVSASHDNFERFVLRVANDDISGYRELMRMPMKEFLRASEAWIERVIQVQKQAKKWRNK